MRRVVDEVADGGRETHLVRSMDDRPGKQRSGELPEQRFQVAIARQDRARLHVLHMADELLMKETGTALQSMAPAHLVVDVQQAGEKIAPVEPEHCREIVAVDAAFVE